MNSIESLKLSYDSQIEDLSNIHNEKLLDNCVFVGSGDSYVAGLIAEFMTGHKCLAYSPSDLINSAFQKDKTYCFISVTGRTKANIIAAKHASESGANTIAVTMHKDSKLSQICKVTVPLDIKKSKTPTAGFSAFTANVLTCLQIVGISVPQKFGIWHRNGTEFSQTKLDSLTMPEDTLFILGNNSLYPIALYASLQLAEFFGTTAMSYRLEEFCHSPIFGLKNTHHLWILGQNEGDVFEKIENLKFQLDYFELYNQDTLSQLFESIFFVQNLILLLAEKHGHSELKYVQMKDVLKLSSEIIYF